MSLEVNIDRPKSDVRTAIQDFAARRGLRVANPWYLDGVRLEGHWDRASNPLAGPTGDVSQPTWWVRWLGSAPEPPAVNIEIKRRWVKGTRLNMRFGKHPDSANLAYALRVYLMDERAYGVHAPIICIRCSAQVPHFLANFCGRCGQPLGSSNVSIPVLPETRPLPALHERRMSNFAPVAVEPTPAMRIEPAPAVRIERTPAEAGVDAVTPLAADPPTREVEPKAPVLPQIELPSASSPQRVSEPSAQEQAAVPSPDGTQAEPSSSNSDVATPTAAPRRAEPMVVED